MLVSNRNYLFLFLLSSYRSLYDLVKTCNPFTWLVPYFLLAVCVGAVHKSFNLLESPFGVLLCLANPYNHPLCVFEDILHSPHLCALLIRILLVDTDGINLLYVNDRPLWS